MIHNRYKNSLQTRKISNGESSKSTSPTRSSSYPDLEDATDSIVHLSGKNKKGFTFEIFYLNNHNRKN